MQLLSRKKKSSSEKNDAHHPLNKGTRSLVASAADASKSVLGKMFFLALAFCMVVGMTSATASAQTAPSFDFTTWFGYDPSAWVGVIITAISAVIILVVPFTLGVRVLMRVIGWAKRALAAR